MSNQLCRFYLKGYCKFGNTCRFSHDDGRSFQSDRYRVDNRGKNKTNDITPEDILEMIREDVSNIQECNIWPLTSFGPSESIGNIDGFEDISPEEARVQFFLSYQSGTIDQFRNNFNRYLQIAKHNRDMYINKTNKAYSIVGNMLNRQSYKKPEITPAKFQVNRPEPNAVSAFSFNSNSMFGNEKPTFASFPVKRPECDALSTFSFNPNSIPNNFPSNLPTQHQSYSGVIPPVVQNNALDAFSFKTGPLALFNNGQQQRQANMPQSWSPHVKVSFSQSSTSHNVAPVINVNATDSFKQLINNNNNLMGDFIKLSQSSSVSSSNEDASNRQEVNYTDEEIQAFKANQFILGHVPLTAPPKNMC